MRLQNLEVSLCTGRQLGRGNLLKAHGLSCAFLHWLEFASSAPIRASQGTRKLNRSLLQTTLVGDSALPLETRAERQKVVKPLGQPLTYGKAHFPLKPALWGGAQPTQLEEKRKSFSGGKTDAHFPTRSYSALAKVAFLPCNVCLSQAMKDFSSL